VYNILTLNNILNYIFRSFEQYLQLLPLREKQYHDWIVPFNVLQVDSGDVTDILASYIRYPCKIHRHHGDEDVTKKSYKFSFFVSISTICNAIYRHDVSGIQLRYGIIRP
jgi:hypothetical protein